MIKIDWGDFFCRRVIFGLWTVKRGRGVPLGTPGPILIGRDAKTTYQLRFWPPWKESSLKLPWYGCWNWETIEKKHDQD